MPRRPQFETFCRPRNRNGDRKPSFSVPSRRLGTLDAICARVTIDDRVWLLPLPSIAPKSLNGFGVLSAHDPSGELLRTTLISKPYTYCAVPGQSPVACIRCVPRHCRACILLFSHLPAGHHEAVRHRIVSNLSGFDMPARCRVAGKRLPGCFPEPVRSDRSLSGTIASMRRILDISPIHDGLKRAPVRCWLSPIDAGFQLIVPSFTGLRHIDADDNPV